MSAKVCLRCDWSGSIASDNCPRCGAPLHGGAQPRPGPTHTVEAGPSETTEVRSRSGVVAVILVLALGVAAVAFVQRHTPATPAPPPRSALGYLVYAANDDTGSPRLWVWNLSTATVVAGPPLRSIPTELLFSYTVASGWVSLTMPTPAGISQAVVLRTLDPTALPDTMGRGQLVTWLSSGGYLSVAETARVDGCHHRVRVVSSNIATDNRQLSLDAVLCGEPTTLGRDLTQPYVTIEHEGRATVYRVNEHGLLPVLRGYRALSISLNGDLLVQRPGQPGSLFYDYPSPAGQRPIPIGRAGSRFISERVLGWNGDGSDAYVLGEVGGVRGIYRIPVAPRARPRSPALLLRTDAADVSASTTPTSDVYVSTDGAVTLVQDGTAHPLSRPDGAPAPVGPLLWISTLPYSTSVAG